MKHRLIVSRKLSVVSSYYFCLFLTLLSIYPNLAKAQSKNIVDKIWNSAGGKNKWESTKYIMFTVSGNSQFGSITGTRKFLLDKQSNLVRFEGTFDNENIVAILNVQNQKLIRLYDENGTELSVTDFKGLVSELAAQYKIDLKVLALPASIATASLDGGSESKIINAEKLQKVDFNNFLGGSGSVYVNEESGMIKRIDMDNKSYIVNGYKDIGNGLVLPTIFKGSNDSISYQKVASFTEMETEKFKSF
ncbi:hypothetical protein [Sphingobacterium sp. CZ-2]|uniref:hypothetical protein n=1 Tax=Sphingobacterium sp. CZ-2 TaxID=2557994 RepID=UPI00106F7566|nr:hypothetical protein [Sphingobacterium sp. CZ-2]QBR13426.1 hypothetical protein E3D81_15085 [Sphingobacterium sp. CZ-2]